MKNSPVVENPSIENPSKEVKETTTSDKHSEQKKLKVDIGMDMSGLSVGGDSVSIDKLSIKSSMEKKGASDGDSHKLAIPKEIAAQDDSSENPTRVSETGKAGDDRPGGGHASFESKIENPALKEIGLKEYSPEQLEKTEARCRELSFVDGKGDRLTHAEAADAMMDDLKGSLEKLKDAKRPIDDSQIDAILKDVKKTIYSQEAESESRALNNHGIPHIYGVYERMKDTDEQVLETAARHVREQHPGSEATAEDIRAGMILAAIYHDEGYLSEATRRGVNHGGTEVLHGVDSAVVFEHKHRQLYEGAVDPAVLSDTRQAILEHNVMEKLQAAKDDGLIQENGARAQALEQVQPDAPSDLDPNKNFIRSALLLSDKMAMDTEEKVPDVLRDKKRMGIVQEHFYDAQQQGLLEKELTDEQKRRAEAASDSLRYALKEAVNDDEGLTKEQKEAYKKSIMRDVSIRSGGFVLPLTTVVTPSDAVSFHMEDDTIKAKAVVYTLDDAELKKAVRGYRADETAGRSEQSAEQGTPPELKKPAGFLKDIGIPSETIKEYDDWLSKTSEGRSGEQPGTEFFRVNTESMPYLKNVEVQIRPVRAELEKPSISDSTNAILKKYEAYDAKMNGDNLEKATEQFNEQYRTGNAANRETILDYLNAMCVKAENNPGLLDEIESIRASLASEDDDQLDALVERCRRLPVRIGQAE